MGEGRRWISGLVEAAGRSFGLPGHVLCPADVASMGRHPPPPPHESLGFLSI